MGALTDKYCIVGVGETPHMRPSQSHHALDGVRGDQQRDGRRGSASHPTSTA